MSWETRHIFTFCPGSRLQSQSRVWARSGSERPRRRRCWFRRCSSSRGRCSSSGFPRRRWSLSSAQRAKFSHWTFCSHSQRQGLTFFFTCLLLYTFLRFFSVSPQASSTLVIMAIWGIPADTNTLRIFNILLQTVQQPKIYSIIFHLYTQIQDKTAKKYTHVHQKTEKSSG